MRLVLGLALGLAGCRPEVGDKCQTSVDCSQLGDRLCDISQPDGYCTIYNCEPKASNGATKCPDEAVCIVYAVEQSAVPGCQNRLGNTPYSRSFCMKTCDNTTDCRSGYLCLDVGAPGNRWAAVNADSNEKVCTQPFSLASVPHREPGVCTAGDPDGGDATGSGGAGTEPDGAGGAAASSGSGGQGGA